MAFYGNSASPAAPGTTNDVLTLTGASNRRAKIYEISVTGLGNSSAANELSLRRPSTLGVTPTNQASERIDPDSEAAGATIATAWSTQPNLSGSIAICRLGANSNGGVYRWVPNPGMEPAVRDSVLSTQSQLSMRFSTGGAGPMAIHILFEDHI